MKVTIEGHGTFDINEQKLPQLLQLLSGGGVRLAEDSTVRERTDNGFTGRELLNG